MRLSSECRKMVLLSGLTLTSYEPVHVSVGQRGKWREGTYRLGVESRRRRLERSPC